MAYGLTTLVWHDYHGSPALRYIVYAAAAAQIVGGAAIQFRQTAKTGAGILGLAYLIFALLTVPRIVASPQVYNSWGNFFEQFSLAIGALIAYARLSSTWKAETLARTGRVLLGICTASFTLEQAMYLDATASLVPKWLPPGQMFWAVATTVLFGLAAGALLGNRMALLATRLLTLMLVLFGVIVWVPLLLADPHSHANWSEIAETFAIAGSTWILADFLSRRTRQLTPSV